MLAIDWNSLYKEFGVCNNFTAGVGVVAVEDYLFSEVHEIPSLQSQHGVSFYSLWCVFVHLLHQFFGWGQIRPSPAGKAWQITAKTPFSSARPWEFCHFRCCCIWSCPVPQRQVAQSELELMMCTHLLQGTWGQHLKTAWCWRTGLEIDRKVWREITDGPG